ncbi:uncharacterized protein BT62DRAFT_60568 [Guyanagaster necrorhizus]|uniref:MYND-type domain-containing protein n=1 Tax=Guyanagaster necrorhizus TaxID=856835 RepID=A0A9P7VTF2_9AGAR|nr:uncharacterized protein BT62DRAFT_60568 [Guyanagaster necrorhizus MCA 3950]KAG7447088.1 hypothetical protein BT62DRAFT_60568 [Guyanagaster necrorhizus MCA 3950]
MLLKQIHGLNKYSCRRCIRGVALVRIPLISTRLGHQVDPRSFKRLSTYYITQHGCPVSIWLLNPILFYYGLGQIRHFPCSELTLFDAPASEGRARRAFFSRMSRQYKRLSTMYALKVKELALRGSGDALVQLGEFARDNSTMLPHLVHVVRVFLKYLPPPEMIDKLSPKDVFKSLDRIASYFNALNVALQSPQALDRFKSAGLVITCPQIYLWAVDFFHHYFIHTDITISVSPVSLITVRIVEFLGTLAIDPDYCAKMRDTKGFTFSMTVLWIHSIHTEYGQVETIVRVAMMYILQKRTLGSKVSNAFNRVQNEVSNAFNWVQKPIVEELCARIVAREREPNADYDGGIIFLFVSAMYSRPFTRAFISCHSVSWICRRIADIAAKKEETCSPNELTGYSRLLKYSLIYLLRAFQEGSDRIIEGLDTDLIPALLRAQSKVHADDKEAILVPLLHLMTSYTLYRNVLAKLCKVLYTADLKPGISEAGPIGDAWTALKETTETRWGMLKDYMASGRELTKCSYYACPHPDNGPMRTPRRCKGCCFEYYCSQECQKLDWGDGHNDRCRMIQDDLQNGFPIPMSKRERHFAYAIIEKDIQDNAQLIQKLKSEKPRGRGGFVVLLTVTDYTQVPMKLYVLTDEEFHTTETVPAEWDTALALAKEAGKDLVLLKIPLGAMAQLLLKTYPFDFNTEV